MNPIIKYWQEIQNGLIVSEKIRRLYEKLNADLSDADSEWEYSEGKAPERTVNPLFRRLLVYI